MANNNRGYAPEEEHCKGMSEGGSQNPPEGHTTDGIEGVRAYGAGDLVEIESLGASGSFEPAGPKQPFDLVVFDKNRPPRGEDRRPVFAVKIEDESPVCGSPKRKKRGYCCDPARMANGRCHRHGGNARRGIAHPRFSDGKTSKYVMPPKLLERYEKYLMDPELTHHRSSIAQIESLIAELWEAYEEGVGPELWNELQQIYKRLKTANDAGDYITARRHFEELGFVIDRGAQHTSQGERILKHLAERRKHADSETRRKLSESLVYSVEEAYVFYTSLGASVRKHVRDEEVQNAILNDIYAIAGDYNARGQGPASRSGEAADGPVVPPGS
jgi:hypothetical protein